LDPGRILAPAAGRCLNDPRPQPLPIGTPVTIADCNDAESQAWTQLSATAQIRIYENRCLDVFQHNTNPGGSVVTWDCNTQANQRFRFNRDGTIVGLESGLCLNRQNGGTANGTRVVTAVCNGSAAQKWIR
jgi:hypothetical protein